MWPRLPRRQTAEFVHFCTESVASSLVGVVGLNFWISWRSFVVNSVQVSLHPRGVRAKEGCSTEQSTLVSAFEFSGCVALFFRLKGGLVGGEGGVGGVYDV